ncbi:TcmI family type II polyketide cyclase [Amycolatopsis sp. A133]|uniref:TcmI family type II polyketide cyclase n=1 Tax=Amycolatopsis sp. A133 TaxID=3064472 RepID=UPI0027F8857E|nr:TcmI family type II polyketide cyclase [Amycolatopsis sp. A133]MDQ7803514.1 TcmI family type II polyketide cyclase [Amycolatopsis sp. A133]
MLQTLIVARMDPAQAGAVARIFAESDATGLPALVGVTGRTLLHFHGLYFHAIEARQDPLPELEKVRRHPLFTEVNAELGRYISPFDPSTWTEPKDAMATPFYRWRAQ